MGILNFIILGLGIIGIVKGLDLFSKNKNFIPVTILGLVALVFSLSFTIIPTGYTGVKVTFGQVDETNLGRGFTLKTPIIQSIKTVNNKQQDTVFEDVIWGETNTRTAVQYSNIKVTYSINSEKSAWLYSNVSDFKNLVSLDLLASSIKSSSKTLSDIDATNRSKIEVLAQESLQAALNSKYEEGVVTVSKVVIVEADFEASYNEAVAQKQTAQLAYEQQQIINKQALEKAEADAQVALTKAEADAQVKLTGAEAESKSNELLQQSITEQLIKMREAEARLKHGWITVQGADAVVVSE